MRNRPNDLDDSLVVLLVQEHWALEVADIAYAPWGFGSHHWVVDLRAGGRVFVSADVVGHPEDDASALVRLEAALQSAHAIHEAGLDFVVAPVPAQDGNLVHRLGGRYAAAVYGFVEGETFQPWVGERDSAMVRAGVVDLLVAVHGATPIVTGIAARETFAIDERDVLEAALDGRGAEGDGGPYAERAAEALAAAAEPLRALLVRHDALARDLLETADDWVLTHGEPKAGNLMTSPRGARFIDWDTALIGPAARDLWLVEAGQGRELARYEQESGRRVDPAGLELYRLRWGLADIASYVVGFRGPHEDDDDSRIGWESLHGYLSALSAGRPLPVQTG